MKDRRLKNHLSIILILTFIHLSTLFSCNEPPTILIEEEKLIEILVDVHLAEASVQSKSRNQKEVLLDQHYNRIYQLHQIDSALFDSSMIVLKNDPDHLKAVYEKVMEEIDRLKSK